MCCGGSRQRCCHIIGFLLSLAAVILLIGGFIVVIVFSSNFDNLSSWSVSYAVGIGAVCLGTVLSLCVMVYMCSVLKRQWKVFGCIEIKTEDKRITRLLTSTPPTKLDLANVANDTSIKTTNQTSSLYTRPSHFNDANNDSSAENQKQISKVDKYETDWDPDTILADD